MVDSMYTVGEFAEKMKVSVRTLQYYDKQGLLKQTSHSEGGRRLYSSHDAIILQQILSLKYIGLSLEEIKDKTYGSLSMGQKRKLHLALALIGDCAGAFVGAPTSIVGFYGSDMKKAYVVGGVPLWTALVNSFVSAMLHLFVVAMIIMVLSPLLFDAEAVAEMLPFLGITVCFMLSAISIGMLVGLVVKTPARLSMVTMIIFLFSIMLSGIMLPDELLPEVLRDIGGFFPSRWAFSAMVGIDVGKNVLLMGGMFVAALTLCLIRLRFISKVETRKQ